EAADLVVDSDSLPNYGPNDLKQAACDGDESSPFLKTTATATSIAGSRLSERRDSFCALQRNARSVVEPSFFHAPAVVDAVDRDRQPFELRVPAIRCRRIEDHWSRHVLGKQALDLPHECVTPVLVGF